MCYSMPGRVVELRGNVATVDYFGERRNALADLTDFSAGDYVYVQGGYVVRRIPAEEVEPTLAIWRRLMEKLKGIDRRRSSPPSKKPGDQRLEKLIALAESGKPIPRPELFYALSLEGEGSLDALFRCANSVRMRELSNSCCVHGIIEFSNYCGRGCAFCGINSSNRKLERYRMGIDEIVAAAQTASEKFGFKALVLQSGEDSWYSDEKLAEIVRRVRERCGVLLFMSVGERSERCYRRMYEEGARGALLRFETSNPKIYAQLGKGELGKRLSLLRKLRAMGYLIITGSLVGLPEQTAEDLLNDIELARGLGAEMFSFGPFLPHPQTKLAGSKPPPLALVLKVLATARLAQPDAKILVTTALETLDARGREKGFLAGANSLMINTTPINYRRLYSIYPRRAWADTPVEEQISRTIALLQSLGRAPTDLGISEGFSHAADK